MKGDKFGEFVNSSRNNVYQKTKLIPHTEYESLQLVIKILIVWLLRMRIYWSFFLFDFNTVSAKKNNMEDT